MKHSIPVFLHFHIYVLFLSYIKIEAENFENLVEAYKVLAVPTLIIVRVRSFLSSFKKNISMFNRRTESGMEYFITFSLFFLNFKGKKILDRIEGADVQKLVSSVEKQAKLSSLPATTTFTPEPLSPELLKEKLFDRLRQLIKSHELMVFMKGTPQQPRCGFSRQTIELLNGLKVNYGTFNILVDDDVRQGNQPHTRHHRNSFIYFSAFICINILSFFINPFFYIRSKRIK